MKTITILLLFFIISQESSGQNSPWKKNVFNEILTFELPAKSKFCSSSYIKAFGGEVNSNFYGFQYYDTVFLAIENEKQFQISLTGFMSGRVSDLGNWPSATFLLNLMVAESLLHPFCGFCSLFVP